MQEIDYPVLIEETYLNLAKKALSKISTNCNNNTINNNNTESNIITNNINNNITINK